MRPLALFALVLALSGCDAVSSSYLCTEQFVTVGVRVVDATGRPVEGLATQTTLLRTGEPLATSLVAGSDPQDGADGHYIVATDADAAALRVDGDAVEFVAMGEGVRARGEFILADDGCHVTKEEGPAEITALAL